MKFEPSFNCLYRRSRYSRSEADQGTGSRQHRRELFAVAAVAFALKHHQDFRAHFLRAICGCVEPSEHSVVAIEVQPHHHTDLAIKDTINSTLFVVEFKVGADLERKQNPKHKEDFFAPEGYGTLILHERHYSRFARKTYIVLNDSKEFENGDRTGLTCRSRTWDDLAGAPSGSLWSDLLDSLGDLGVPAFQFQKLTNMRNAQHTKDAVLMHQTLSALAARLKFGKSGAEDINFDGDEAWYGRNIPNKSLPDFNELEMRIEAKESVAGWFGYQSSPVVSERAIWFYCGSEDAAHATQAFVLERLPNLDGKSGIKESNVWISSDERSHPGDAEWFDAIFKALADKPAK